VRLNRLAKIDIAFFISCSEKVNIGKMYGWGHPSSMDGLRAIIDFEAK